MPRSNIRHGLFPEIHEKIQQTDSTTLDSIMGVDKGALKLMKTLYY